MDRDEMEQMLNPSTFVPFVVTTKDGFALPVSNVRDTLLGAGMLVVKFNGMIYHLPLNAIAHIVSS